MGIIQGYKQTEIGMLPNDWEVKKLGELASLKTGPFGSSIHKSDYTVNGIPIINPTHIKDGNLYPEQNMTLTTDTATRLSDFKLKTNDIIIGRRGEMGRCAVIKKPQQGWLCGTGSLIIRPNAKIFPEYLWRIISSPYVIARIVEASVGSTMINLNQAVLLGLNIQCPAITEQHAIAVALSDADALLAALDALIAKKLLIKQGATQELLTGKRRLPGFGDEWEVRKLGELGKSLRGVSYKGDTDLSPTDTNKTTRLLRSNNVQSASVIIEDLQFVNSQRVSDHQIMRENDILICMANGSKDLVGKAAAFHVRDHLKYTFGTFMGCFRLSSDDALPSYVAHTFQTNQYRNYIANQIAGSSINNLKPSDIESIEIPFPQKTEQQAIAEILSDMDAEISALEHRREKTRLLKQGMMQELLTGRIRLNRDL